jgi:hypothetical protein
MGSFALELLEVEGLHAAQVLLGSDGAKELKLLAKGLGQVGAEVGLELTGLLELFERPVSVAYQHGGVER